MSAKAKLKKERSDNWLDGREEALLEMKLNFDEFARNVEVTCNNLRYGRDWRVQGNKFLRFWIFDYLQNLEENLTEIDVIALAYRRFSEIQARKGQLNFHTVYVKGVEEIELFPRKNHIHATVRVVRDNVDGLYRCGISYFVGNGGCGSAPTFSKSDEMFASKSNAILRGAKDTFERIQRSWDSKDSPDKYKPYINKIKEFIENLEKEIRQPSLFDF